MPEQSESSLPPNVIEIHSPQRDSLRVDSMGGRITLKLGDVQILTSVTRGDGKKGETHPCTPIFGPDKNNLFGLSQHGNMRNEQCVATKVSESGNETVIVTHDIADAPSSYPQGVKVEQQFSVKDGKFTFRMTHTNNGEEEAPVNSGEHLYFSAPQGFERTLINDVNVTDLIKNDTAIRIGASSIIKIPGLPELVLDQVGFNYVMLWVGKNADGQPDGDYVCIEPVEGDPENFFGSDESMIPPHGGSRTAWFSISVSNKV